jgi:hypothetical protein
VSRRRARKRVECERKAVRERVESDYNMVGSEWGAGSSKEKANRRGKSDN